MYLILSLFSLVLSFPLIVFAQTTLSNCVITKIGLNPPAPNLPPGCKTQSGPNGVDPITGLECRSDGYCKIPPVADNSYVIESCVNRNWSSKELINVIYTVAKRWKQKYPQGNLYIGDLNGGYPHKSHAWGRAVDLEATTNGSDRVADYSGKWGPYNHDATIELGKMFADTDQVQNIWFNDQSVNYSVLEYANDPGAQGHSKGMVMIPQDGHDNHFHLDVKLDPFLTDWRPDC